MNGSKSKGSRKRDTRSSVSTVTAGKGNSELARTNAGRPTPGPWTVDGDIFVNGPDGHSIFGGASTKRADEECIANARLIAKAPEMVELLREIAAYWPDLHRDFLTRSQGLLKEIER